jgi:hypothetical protein
LRPIERVPGLSGIASTFAAPPNLSWAQDDQGRVWGWGEEYSSGLIGGAQYVGLNMPDPVRIPALDGARRIAAGIAVNASGQVIAWDKALDGRAAFPAGVSVYGCFRESGVREPSLVAGPSNVKSLAVSYADGVRPPVAFAVDGDGRVWTWGAQSFSVQYNGVDQPCSTLARSFTLFGLGGSNSSFIPTPVLIPELTDVTSIAAGRNHVIALKSDGTVWGWGPYWVMPSGQNDIPRPIQLPLTDVVQIAAEGNSSFALRSDGTALNWDDNGAREETRIVRAASTSGALLLGDGTVAAIDRGYRMYPGFNAADTSLSVDPALTLAVSSDAPSVRSGSNVTFTVSVRNPNATSVASISVVFKADPRFTFSALPAACSGSAGMFLCTQPTLAGRATARWQLVAQALSAETVATVSAA